MQSFNVIVWLVLCIACYKISEGLSEGISVRLRGSGLEYAGRVEIKAPHGVWESLWDEQWDRNAARVVCRQLQYTDVDAAIKGEAFGPASSSVMWKLNCTGNERSVDECRSERLDAVSSRNKVAAVLCKPHTSCKGSLPTVWIVSGAVHLVTIVVLIVTCCCACRKSRRNERVIGSASDMKTIGVAFTNESAEGNHVEINPENNYNIPNKDGQPNETGINCELITSEPRPLDVIETTPQHSSSKKKRYMELKRGSKAYFADVYTKLMRNIDRKTDSLAIEVDYAEFSRRFSDVGHDKLDKDYTSSTGEDYTDISSPMGCQDFEYVPDVRHLKKSPAENNQDYLEILRTKEEGAVGVEKVSPDTSKDYIVILPLQPPVTNQRDSASEEYSGYLKLLSNPLDQTKTCFLEDDSGYLKPDAITTELESTESGPGGYVVRVQEPNSKVSEKKAFILPSTLVSGSVDKRLVLNETDVYESYHDGHAPETDKPTQDARYTSPLAKPLAPGSLPKGRNMNENELKTLLSPSELETDTKNDGDSNRKQSPKVSPRFPKKDFKKAQTLPVGQKFSPSASPTESCTEKNRDCPTNQATPSYQVSKPRSTTVPDESVHSAFLLSLEKVIKQNRSLSDPKERENDEKSEEDMYEDIVGSPSTSDYEDSPKRRPYSDDYECMDENKNVLDHLYEHVDREGSSEDDIYEKPK